MTEFWDKRRNIIRTKRGGWVQRKKVISHGYSLLDDLVGNVDYFQIFLLSILGKMPEKRLAKWFEAEYSCMSYPDARLWCNQIGSLAGTCKVSPSAGTLAGVLASDSTMYGPGTVADTYAFLIEAKKEFQSGDSIEDIAVKRSRRKGTKPTIPGYGRPLATGDERVNAMETVAKNLGYEVGETLQLAYLIEEYLLETHEESMNLATYTVAFLMDQGFDLVQIQEGLSFMVASGVAACFMEAHTNPAESFLPLRCDDIEYTGPQAREVPDKE